MKRLYKVLSILMIVTILLAYIPTISKAQTGKVNTEGLNFRNEPNKYADIIDRTFRK